MSFELVELGKLTVNHDGKRKPVKESERKPGPYPYYGASGIVDYVDGYIFDGDYLLIGEDGENLRTHQTPIAFMAKGKFWVNNHAHIVTGNDSADTQYLMYAIENTDVTPYLTGAVMPKITQGNLNKILIPCPSLEIQKKIAKILGRLDDKIELNRQTNQTLEAIAQAIFKSWFVDFDPVKAKIVAKEAGASPDDIERAAMCAISGKSLEELDQLSADTLQQLKTTAALFPDALMETELGLVPEGWNVKTLGEISENHSTTFNFKNIDEVVFVNTGDVQDGWFLHKNYSKKEGLPGQAKKSIKIDDILFSEIRPKNKRFAYVNFDCNDYVVSTKFMIIRSLGFVHPRYLYQILKQESTIEEFNIIADSRSGTFPQITFDAISYFPIVVPSKEIQASFIKCITPLIGKIELNVAANKNLEALRDTLLPKLLSGELSVNSEQRELEKLL